MTAPVFVVRPELLQDARPGGTVALEGPEGRHAAEVRRVRVGEQLDLVDGEGTRARGTVSRVGGAAGVDVRITSVGTEPEPSPRLVVVQALLKGDALATSVELLTEVGVDEIVVWQAERSIPRWSGDKAAKAQQRLDSVVVAAGKQSRRARFPRVAPVGSTVEVAQRLAGAPVALLLHQDAQDPLPLGAYAGAAEIVLVIGPEGGLSPAELEVFGDAGARQARLGPTVLRGQTAGAVAASVVLAGSGRWGADG